MIKPLTSLFATGLLLAVTPLAFSADGALTPDTFESLHRTILPQPDESRWADVPWLTNLDDARQRSRREDKPLLVWRSGGGDVLGRT